MTAAGKLRSAADRIRRWRLDPAAMVREEFAAEPDKWQATFLRAFASKDRKAQRIALKANKGPGKTTVLAWAIWNFMACYGERGEHPKGAATSITGDNLADNLWPELAKWQGRSAFFTMAFMWTKTRIYAKDHPETWFFSARTWPKSADPQSQANTLAGLHAKFLLFVLDESGGIPDAVMATAEAGLANEHIGWAKILQAGNPTHLEGPLYRAATSDRDRWTVLEVTGDPDDPERSPRISEAWAREQIETYGRDNPWVLVNVFGQFPPGSINALLGPDDVMKAMRRYSALEAGSYQWAQKRLGIDVARFGDDRTVLFPRQGLAAFQPAILRHQRTTDIAARVALAIQRWGAELLLIDDTGHWGHGVIDNLHTAGYAPVGIQFHAPAIDSRYKNRRAEMWMLMAEWVKTVGCLPNIEGLQAELTAATYTFSNGKFMLEDKDQIKAKIGRSPDLADGLALTFAMPEVVGLQQAMDRHLTPVGAVAVTHGRMLTEYDPFAEDRF